MRKLILLMIILATIASTTYAKKPGKDGYRIKVEFTDMTDSLIYLVHYYGKPLPTIYKTDSAYLDKNGVAVFQKDTAVLGGIYMILLGDKSNYFEFLLNNGDDISVTAEKSKLPTGIRFKNSPENDRFITYVNYLVGYGEKQNALREKLNSAETKEDTAALREDFTVLSADLKNYRQNYIDKYPNTLLSHIFLAMKTPDVPEGPHYLPDGKTPDSNFAYNYYKDHYWDDYRFEDDRLIHTPIYDGRLDEYFNKLVLPIPDTVQAEADKVLALAKRGSATSEIFKYTLWWLTRFSETSKIMGMDAVFVYLVENYYMKGDAYWLSPDDLAKYVDRAHKIAPNVIGNIAPELRLTGIDGKEHSLHGTQANYTLLIFWSPECGHCLKEMPMVDSVYNAVLKDKGVKIYAVRTEGEIDKWKEVIEENGFDDWIHVYDPEHKSRFRSDYDIYSTPVLYLLDDKKIIVGKRMDHSNVADVIEFAERKKKSKSEKNKS